MLARVVSCALFMVTVELVPAVPAGDSGRDPIVDRRPVIEELTEELTRAAKLSEDAERAHAIVEELHGRYAYCGPRDKRDVLKTFDRVLDRCDLEEPAWGTVAGAVANALASLGEEGVPLLLDHLDDRRNAGFPVHHRRLVLALGRTRHESALTPLERLLQDADPVLQGAAGEALGEFDGLEQERRKDVFYSLLKTLQDAWEKVNRDPTDSVVRERYDVVVGPLTTSLQRLSGHDERDPREWQRFWNKHKKDDWDEPAS